MTEDAFSRIHTAEKEIFAAMSEFREEPSGLYSYANPWYNHRFTAAMKRLDGGSSVRYDGRDKRWYFPYYLADTIEKLVQRFFEDARPHRILWRVANASQLTVDGVFDSPGGRPWHCPAGRSKCCILT